MPRNPIEKVAGAVMVLYLFFSLAIVCGIVWAMFTRGVDLIPGLTWKIVSVLLAINVGISVYRSLVARRFVGVKGLLMSFGGLFILILQLAFVTDMNSMNSSENATFQASEIPDLFSFAFGMMSTVIPCVLPILGIVMTVVLDDFPRERNGKLKVFE